VHEQRGVSQTELDAIRRKVAAHWIPDKSVLSQPDQYVVFVRFHLDRDGRLSAAPKVVSTRSAPHYQAAAEPAKRAVVLSQAFDMLSPSNYESWQEVEINFSPFAMCSRAEIAWVETHPEIVRSHPDIARQCDAARSLTAARNPQ